MTVHELKQDDARHLLRRLSFTATPEQERSLLGRSRNAAFDLLWNYSTTASAAAAPAFLQQPWRNSALAYRHSPAGSAEYAARRTAQLRTHAEQTEQLRQRWLEQMIRSPAGLRENLTLFLHDYFGSSTTAVEIPQALHARNVLMWKLAMTSFPDLLEQLVLDPAMMMQIGMDGHGLDRVSDRPAKLVLDYWTVGSGGYIDRDVEELSRALTGWSLGAATSDSTLAVDDAAPYAARRTGLMPTFDPQNFDAESKTLMGITDNFDARSALRLLAMQPATARRFSGQLLRYFGVNDPQRQLQRRLEAIYLQQQGSMQALLQELVTADEFWSMSSRWALIKSPVHLAVAACRQLRMPAVPAAGVSQWLSACGQTLFDTPNNGEGGWPDQQAWITPPDRLMLRYQLPKVLSGATLQSGLTGSATAGQAAVPMLSLPQLPERTTELLLERLDPAPGLTVNSVGVRRIASPQQLSAAINSIMATPQYQLI